MNSAPRSIPHAWKPLFRRVDRDSKSLSAKPLFNNEILEQRKLHYRIG